MKRFITESDLIDLPTGGRDGREPKFLRFMQFSGKIGQIVGPPLGNLRSVTEYCL